MKCGRLWGESAVRELSIGHVKSEMLVGHPNGGVRKTSMEFRGISPGWRFKCRSHCLQLAFPKPCLSGLETWSLIMPGRSSSGKAEFSHLPLCPPRREDGALHLCPVDPHCVPAAAGRQST